MRIIARGNHGTTEKKLKLAGADQIILPFEISGLKVAKSILILNVENIFDITGVDKDDDHLLRLTNLEVGQGSFLANKTLENCEVASESLIIV